MHLSYNVYSKCILCLAINLSVVVSCNSIQNRLVYFIDVLYICIYDIVHREETTRVRFVNCCQCLYLDISLLDLRGECGI